MLKSSFVQGKGFTPAGLVTLGNSIVTRAGPSLQVTGIEKKNTAQTVYNFSVAEFHTYFVGKSGLWTHNVSCDELISKAVEEATNSGMTEGTVVVMWVPGHGFFSGRSKAGMLDAEWDTLIHQDVKDLYNDIPVGARDDRFHLKCAEVHALSKMVGTGINLTNFPPLTMSCAVVIRPGKKSHADPLEACDSCKDIFYNSGVWDVGRAWKLKQLP